MLFTLWSVKGGSGTSVVSAGLATLLTQRGREVLLVDLAGDQPALLGIPEPTGPGVGDWMGSPDGDAAALGRLEIEVADGRVLRPHVVPGRGGDELEGQVVGQEVAEIGLGHELVRDVRVAADHVDLGPIRGHDSDAPQPDHEVAGFLAVLHLLTRLTGPSLARVEPEDRQNRQRRHCRQSVPPHRQLPHVSFFGRAAGSHHPRE